MLFLLRRSLTVLYCICAFLLYIPWSYAETAAKIAAALDNPPGVVFSASNNSSWDYKTGTVSGIVPSGIAAVNGNYMVCSSPGKATPQKQNFFTITVQGSGILSFNYQVSLDDYNWAELCAYQGDILEGWLWGVSGYWDNDVDPAWWYSDWIDLGTETYTHQVTFSVLGPDSEYYEAPELYADWGEILYNKAWLDNFVWTPDPDYMVLGFYPDPTIENGFNNNLTVYLDSAYDNLTFRYTTDGSIPTAESLPYLPETGIELTETTTISVIVLEGTQIVGEPVYQVTYWKKTSPPLFNLTQNDMQNSTLLTFTSDTAEAQFYYTLNNQVPLRLEDGTPGENTFTGAQVILNQAVTVQAMTWKEGLANSDIMSLTYEKLQPPEITFSPDTYPPSSHPYFDNNGTLTLTAAEGITIKYQINGGDILVYENPLTFDQTTEIRFQTQQEGKLHSDTVTRTFYRTDTQLTLPVPTHGWNLFFLPGEVSEQTSTNLITQWQPIAYDSKKRVYYNPQRLYGGNSYWVFVPAAGLPAAAAFNYFPGPVSVPPQKWLLSGNPGNSFPDALQSQTWNGKIFQPALPPKNAPAWFYNTGSDSAELTPQPSTP